jgi:hypothetical protein
MSVHYGSVFYDEQELLAVMLMLHNGGDDIELDPMYNKGMFYKKVLNKPKYRYDLNAEANNYDCLVGDATNLPHENASIQSMIIDPPFMFGTHGQTKNNIINKRYTMYDSWQELEDSYKALLTESRRVLKKNGLLIFKCQDYTDSKTTLTHCKVYDWATELGFYAKDIALLVRPNKIYNGNTTQRHLRKVHSYFFVLSNRGLK